MLSTVIRLGAQPVVQELLEHGVTDFLGRAHYRRGPLRITGYRNGHKPKNVPTAEGCLPVQVSQVRATAEPYRPSCGFLGTRPNRTCSSAW